MTAFGTRPTYQIFAVVCLITGLIYFFFNLCYLKKRPQMEGNDIIKKAPKDKLQISNAIDTSAKNEAKKMEAMEGKENTAFNGEFTMGNFNETPSAKTLETANNAKNLDSIERMPDENKLRARTVNSVDGNRKVGVTNAAYESETNGVDCIPGEKERIGDGQ